jgi:hypothetical protein
MGVHDSNPSDDPSNLSSSSSEKDDGSQTSATTDSSWSLATKETKQVNRSKVLLLGVLAISAAVLGLLTFLIVGEDEEDDFRAAVSSKSYGVCTRTAAAYFEAHIRLVSFFSYCSVPLCNL